MWDRIDEGNRFETVLQSYEHGIIYTGIDNTELKPNETAEMIKKSFRL